ncbi:MAG: LacI family transcriptional regulator, partial [Chloroflexota bacterium]|nr:LacI family transcriptional regulator [Chloroflexota bacterium]
MVTIQDVAAHAGVSAMTVSRVINKHARVASGTRRRVEQSISELGYVPNALARGLIQGRTRTIALIVSDISNPFFTEIARGVEDVAQRNGYAVILGNSDESTEKERLYVNAMLSNRTDGLLIAAAGRESRKTLDFLDKRGTRFVLIDRDVEGVQADAVVGDSVGGARMLTEHLIALTHRRIGLVAGPLEVSTARDRLRGYQEALRAHHIALDGTLVVESDYKRQGGYRAAQQLLALPIGQRPSAVLASNNFLAVGVIEGLRAARVKVPEDIAVVCFDDLELASALDPFLTVAAQPARTFGTVATQFLLERLEGTESLPRRKVVLPPEL